MLISSAPAAIGSTAGHSSQVRPLKLTALPCSPACQSPLPAIRWGTQSLALPEASATAAVARPSSKRQ